MNLKAYGIAALLAISIATNADAGRFVKAPAKGVPDTYVVGLAEGVAAKPDGRPSNKPRVAQVAKEMAAAHGGKVTHVWEHALHGFVIRMPEARAQRLAEDPRVSLVEQDYFVSAPVTPCSASQSMTTNPNAPWNPNVSPQVLSCDDPDPSHDTVPGSPRCMDNWGLDHIDGLADQRFYFGNTASTVHVYIMDTGIRLSHVEFQGRIDTGFDATVLDGSQTPSLEDCAGHGTHVAGIIGGRTYGVAKNVKLHPVRIDTRPDGSFPCDDLTVTTYYKTALNGINWIRQHVQAGREAAQQNQTHYPVVVNWSGANLTSIGAPTSNENKSNLTTAVGNLVSDQILLVQSAGNAQGPYSPPTKMRDACDYTYGETHPEVLVVGGTDYYGGRMATASGFGSTVGSCIDIWAPAADVISAWRTGDDQLCSQTGTSMAAPHVTGVAALYLQANPTATPADVVRALRSRGTWNTLQTSTASPKYIGSDSDNVFLSSVNLTMGTDTAPVASLGVNCPGRQCTFNSNGSFDDHGIVEYSWDFGDGEVMAGAGLTGVSHLYPANFGSDVNNPKYAVLRVRDSNGKTDHKRIKISVNADAPPVPVWTYSCDGLTCTFNSSNSEDDFGIASRKWTFTGGATSTSVIATNTFPAWNEFYVSLEVTDTAGQTNAQALAATLVMPPPANVTATGTSGSATVQWTPVTGVDGYIVERKVDGNPWTVAVNVTGGSLTSATDASPSAPYGIVLYRVLSKSGATVSAPSNNDVAFVETTEAITTTTPIRAAHLIQLRKAVNGLLVIGGGTAYFSADDLNETLVKQQEFDDAHFSTVMNKLNDARTDGDVGLGAVSFRPAPPDPPTQGGPIEDTYIIDVRAGIQ